MGNGGDCGKNGRGRIGEKSLLELGRVLWELSRATHKRGAPRLRHRAHPRPAPLRYTGSKSTDQPAGHRRKDAMEFVYTDELREYMSKKGYDTILLSVFTPHT